MSMTDPIADMLTRIRNAQKARLEEVAMPFSRMKADIAVDDASRSMTLTLRYTAAGEPVIRGLRRYSAAADIPRVLGGLGHSIISTSTGVMAGRQARKLNLGGEILCTIW